MSKKNETISLSCLVYVVFFRPMFFFQTRKYLDKSGTTLCRVGFNLTMLYFLDQVGFLRPNLFLIYYPTPPYTTRVLTFFHISTLVMACLSWWFSAKPVEWLCLIICLFNRLIVCFNNYLSSCLNVCLLNQAIHLFLIPLRCPLVGRLHISLWRMLNSSSDICPSLCNFSMMASSTKSWRVIFGKELQ